jgi:preprotein translocase subunit SecD
MRKAFLIAGFFALVAVLAAVSVRYLIREKPAIEWVYRLDYAYSDRQIEAVSGWSANKSALKEELARLASMRREAPKLALRFARLRIEEAGIKNAQVELFDDDRRLRILLPNRPTSRYEKIRLGLRTMGRLSFHLVASADRDREIIKKVLDPNNPQHSYGGYEICYIEHTATPGLTSRGAVAIQRLPLADGYQVVHADAGSDGQGGWEIRIRLNAIASVHFEQATGENVGKRLAIVLDGVCCSTPTIKERIAGELRISGSFSQMEALELAALLRCQQIPPVDLVPESERSLKPNDE